MDKKDGFCRTKQRDTGYQDVVPDESRSPLAVGYAWAARITNIGIGMAIPVLLGVWLDHKFGTVVVFLLLGVFLGMGTGLLQLIRIARGGGP